MRMKFRNHHRRCWPTSQSSTAREIFYALKHRISQRRPCRGGWSICNFLQRIPYRLICLRCIQEVWPLRFGNPSNDGRSVFVQVGVNFSGGMSSSYSWNMPFQLLMSGSYLYGPTGTKVGIDDVLAALEKIKEKHIVKHPNGQRLLQICDYFLVIYFLHDSNA